MSTVEVPLTPDPQSFSIALAGVEYRLTVKWNHFSKSWILDVADSSSVPIINGIPLVTGADLLAQYAYLNFGGTLWVRTDEDEIAIPTLANLGINSHLYFVTSDG